MQRIYVCNSYSDSISEIDLVEFKENRQIKYDTSRGRIGPQGICIYKEYIITTDTYEGNVAIINLQSGGIEKFYIGYNCNDIKIYNDLAYITCGDTNDVKVFNLKNKIIEESIPCGSWPHSIDICEELGIILVCNMLDGTLTFIDLFNHSNTENMYVGQYPTRAIFHKDKGKAMVCVTELGKEENGALKIIDLNFRNIDKVELGKGPIDLCCINNMAYISNFEEGSISIINLEKKNEEKRMHLGGMPRGIVADKEYIYVVDYYGSYLYRIDIRTDKKQKIKVGNEPTTVLLC